MSVYHALVPIFFVVMGMMVDITSMGSVIVFGSILTILAILSKVLGCGIPALATGFNKWGSWRIGIGMLPRGEVALIVAGIGLSNGIIGSELFGVSIMMTIITTLLAPIILVPSFMRGGEGRRGIWQHQSCRPTLQGICPCSSADRALASGARSVGSSPARGTNNFP